MLCLCVGYEILCLHIQQNEKINIYNNFLGVSIVEDERYKKEIRGRIGQGQKVIHTMKSIWWNNKS